MGSIAIVGLRAGGGPLAAQALDRLMSARWVVASSADNAAARAAAEAGVHVLTYAALSAGPEAGPEGVAEGVCRLADDGDVVLLAASYPLMREGILSALLDRAGARVEVVPALSPLETLILALDGDLTADMDIVDARALKGRALRRGSHIVVTGVDSDAQVRRVSERLAEAYPVGHAAVVTSPCADGSFELERTTIGGLAERGAIRHGSAVYVPPVSIAPPHGFDELVRIMARLRNPEDGCPWDLAQTHMSIRGHLIEETYEAVVAIEEGDDVALADELGDILLQVVFHARLAAERGAFSIDDALASINEKLRRRHPHIFGDTSAATPEEVLHQWEAIKRDEKPGAGVLESVPHALPALLAAGKISKKAAATGFDWETVDDVWLKVHEEMDELKAAREGTPEVTDEVGDLLFTVVNVARKLGVDAETALRGTNEKFRARFGHMERAARAMGTDLAHMDVASMEELWRRAKDAERGGSPGGR